MEQPEHIADRCAIHLADGNLLLSASYLTSQIAYQSDKGYQQGHQSAYHHRSTKAAGIGIEFCHHLVVGHNGDVRIVGHQPFYQLIGFLQAFHRLEADVQIVHPIRLATIVAEAGSGIGIGDTANTGVLIHADDGVRAIERGADNLLAHCAVPTGYLLHALFKLPAYHHLTQRVGLFCKRSARDDGDAHHVEIAVAHIEEVCDVHILSLAARQIDVVAALVLR